MSKCPALPGLTLACRRPNWSVSLKQKAGFSMKKSGTRPEKAGRMATLYIT